MQELTVNATLDTLSQVQKFVESQLEAAAFPMQTIMEISIAVEEIYVNIARYAYNPQVGQATIRLQIIENPLSVSIQFLDNGAPFNPLAKEDANIKLPVELRDIGGLGILMVKRSMDCVDYTYEHGTNILTITKSKEPSSSLE